MSDFSKDTKKPQPRPSTQFDAQAGDTPTTGFDDAPRVGLPGKGPGQGIPPSAKKIH